MNKTILKNENGQLASAGFSILVIGLLIGLGLIYDVGKIYRTKHAIQTAVDSALIGCGEWYFRVSPKRTEREMENCLEDTFNLNVTENTSFKFSSDEMCNKKVNVSSNTNNAETLVSDSNCFCNDGFRIDATFNNEDVDGDGKGDPKTLNLQCARKVDSLLLTQFTNFSSPMLSSSTVSVEGRYALEGGLNGLMVAIVLDFSKSLDANEMDRIINGAIQAVDLLSEGDYLAVHSFNAGYNGNWKIGMVGGPIWIKNVISPMSLVNDSSKTIVKGKLSGLLGNYDIWKNDGTYGQGGLYGAREVMNKFDPLGDYQKVIIFLSDGEMLNSAPWPQSLSEPSAFAGQEPPNGGKDCQFTNTCSDFYTYKIGTAKTKPYPDQTYYERNLWGPGYNNPAGTCQECDPAGNKVYKTPGYDSSVYPQFKLHADSEDYCQNQKSGTSMAVLQSDYARKNDEINGNGNISVITICSQCKTANSVKRLTLKRIAASNDLPEDWLSQIGTGPHGKWMLPEDANEKCYGYDGYKWNNLEMFNYQKDVAEYIGPQKYWEPTSGQIELEDIFPSIITDLKGGKLIK